MLFTDKQIKPLNIIRVKDQQDAHFFSLFHSN